MGTHYGIRLELTLLMHGSLFIFVSKLKKKDVMDLTNAVFPHPPRLLQLILVLSVDSLLNLNTKALAEGFTLQIAECSMSIT
jgi:hypothetical protein